MLQLAVHRAGGQLGLDGIEQLPVEVGLMVARMDWPLWEISPT